MNAQELFHETVGKLAETYKDHPAMLESFANDVKKSFDVLLEWGDFGGINKAIEMTQPRTFSKSDTSYSGAATGPVEGENMSENPGQTVTYQQIQDAGNAFIEMARLNPVAAQRFLESDIIPEIEKAAEKQFGVGADLGGQDWHDTFKDAVSGKLEQDVEQLKGEIAENDAKEAEKAEKAAKKEGEKAAKAQNKEFWANQKKMGFRDKYNKMVKEDESNRAEAEKLERAGYDPSIYGDIKKEPGFLRRLKEKYLKWRSEAVDAMKCGDTVRLEAAYNELKKLKTLCESLELDVDVVFG